MSDGKSLAIIPRTVDECTDLAERFSKSTLLPKAMQGKMPDVLVTIMAGQEMGLAPMASLRAIHVIEGKPVLSADGMVAIVLGSGKAVYFERVEESDKAVTYETLRVGSKSPRRATWTIEMAKTAAIHLKDNWRAHPRAMLAARAKSELARDVYPDVLMGCYTADELERPEVTIAPRVVVDIPDAEIVEPADSEAISLIASAQTEDQLKTEIVSRLSAMKLTGDIKKAADKAYRAKLESLRGAAA